MTFELFPPVNPRRASAANTKKTYEERIRFPQGQKGAVVTPPAGKTRITIRLDEDILAWFRRKVHKAGGGNYQTLINQALRTHINERPESIEDVVRRVVREEIRRSA